MYAVHLKIRVDVFVFILRCVYVRVYSLICWFSRCSCYSVINAMTRIIQVV